MFRPVESSPILLKCSQVPSQDIIFCRDGCSASALGVGSQNMPFITEIDYGQISDITTNR